MANHCFYIGSVDGHAESTASAYTCYGFLYVYSHLMPPSIQLDLCESYEFETKKNLAIGNKFITIYLVVVVATLCTIFTILPIKRMFIKQTVT